MSASRWARGAARKADSDSDFSDCDSQDDEAPAKKSPLTFLKDKSKQIVRRGSGNNGGGQNTTSPSGGGGATSGKPPRMRNPLRKNSKNKSMRSLSSEGEMSWDEESRDGGIPISKQKRGGKKNKKSSRGGGGGDDSSYNENNENQGGGGRAKGLFRRLSGGGGSSSNKGDGTNNNSSRRGAASEHSYDDDSYVRETNPSVHRTQSGSAISSMKHKLTPSFLRRTQSEHNSDDSGGGGPKRPPRGGLRNKRTQSDGSVPMGGSKGVSFVGDGSVRGGGAGDDPLDGMGSSHVVAPPSTPTGKSRNVERARYSVYHGQGPRAVKKKFRVRPYRAFPEPVYMTEEEIYADSLLPSKKTDFVKSYLLASTRTTRSMDVPDQIRTRWGTPNEDGRIGSVSVEILGCVSLNRQKPDVCSYVVCGDSAFCTDTIQGYRSPMWPASSKRSAVFPIHHAFAKLYIAVFDVRKRTNKDHDVFCGRVVIDLATVRPDTEYDTTLPLRVSTFVYDKRKRGVIRIRFALHWFSERGVVLSYLQSVQSLDDKYPLFSGQPTIPCADPRTFRNVAFTVHGQDLPGKYSKSAFRATIRELNLYQVNLRQMMKVIVLDLMFYENKVVSFYMFFSSMYCVYRNSVALVPSICIGYILLQYLNNYRHYVIKKDFNFGYKPLTITELARSVLTLATNPSGSSSVVLDPKKHAFQPIEVEKWTKRRADGGANKYKALPDSSDENEMNNKDGSTNGGIIRPLDHREFPFAQRDAYPNFCVEDALAPGSTKNDTGRLHGRLSVYYAAKDDDAGPAAGLSGVEDDDSDDASDHDDETVMSESNMMGDDGFDMDSASDEDAESNLQGADMNYKRVALAERQAKGKVRLIQRVHLGPPQDNDTKGKKVPPQVTLKKMENLMYKFSKKVSVEFVHAGPQDDDDVVALGMLDNDTGMTQPSKELRTKMAQKAKKAQSDEYDKILGLTVSYTNPIQRIMSSFMGPVMRMMRVPIYIARIVFHLSTWRDPILSFWLLVLLILFFVLLIVFPWRSFFFLSSFALLGPQNLFLRKILEKRQKEKEEKKNQPKPKKLKEDSEHSTSSTGSSQSSQPKSGWLMGSSNNNKKKSNKKSTFYKEVYNAVNPKARVPFSTTGQASTSKKMPTRSVAVPYSLLKKDRFFDWPPDPTVARATPIPLFDDDDDNDDSMTLSGPEGHLMNEDNVHSDDDDDDDDDHDHDVGVNKNTKSARGNNNNNNNGLRQRKPNNNNNNSAAVAASKNNKGSFVPPQDIAF